MTSAEKLIFFRNLVGEPSGAERELAAYLSLAANEVLRRAFPYDNTQNAVPDKYAMTQCQIAQYLWNKRGAEGQTSHGENGINRSYESGGIPASLLNQITPNAGVPS